MQKGTKILLTWEECMTAHFFAKTRQRRNEAVGMVDKMFDKNRDPIDLNMQGLGGEIAFAKMVNCYPNLTTSPQRGTSDYRNGDGRTIDVKTVFHENPNMMTRKEKAEFPSDYYVLLNGQIKFPVPTYTSYLAEFELFGWATGEEFLQEENLDDLGWGECFVLKGHFLHPDLNEIINYPIYPA